MSSSMSSDYSSLGGLRQKSKDDILYSSHVHQKTRPGSIAKRRGAIKHQRYIRKENYQ